jgi:hypothetical protein
MELSTILKIKFIENTAVVFIYFFSPSFSFYYFIAAFTKKSSF